MGQPPRKRRRTREAGGPVGDPAARLADFAEVSGGWFWETDARHRFVFMTDSVTAVTGVTPEWHYGKTRQEIGVPASVDPAVWRAHLAALDRHEPFRDFVYSRKGPDGTKWLRTSGQPFFDEDGAFLGYRGIASDVTAEVEARRQLEVLAQAIEQLSDIFVLWDAEDRLMLCNERFRALNAGVPEAIVPGTPFETYLRKGIAAGLFPGAVGREDEWREERLAMHRNPGDPVEQQRQDGRWLLVTDQKIAGGATVTISTDITDLKLSQARATGQANIIETALRAMPDGMLILDDTLEFVSWNDRLFEIVGIEKAAIVDAPSPARAFRRMMAARGEYGPGDPDKAIAAHEARLRRSEPIISERQLANGRWIEVRHYPIPGGGYLAIFRDFTERHEIDRMKGEFISTVSHELRTPLTSILGSTGLLAGGAVGMIPPKAQELLSIAHSNGERLLALINDILDIEKITAGKMKYRMATIPLPGLLDEAIEANQGYGERYKVTFRIGGTVPDVQIRGDRVRLMQVMSNLLSNAAKFSPEGGIVELSAAVHSDRARISVRDRGAGIPEAFRSRVFEKFTQADSSDRRGKSGTGLGLAICKAIVEDHGGTIGFVTSSTEGTTFSFELPLTPADRT